MPSAEWMDATHAARKIRALEAEIFSTIISIQAHGIRGGAHRDFTLSAKPVVPVRAVGSAGIGDQLRQTIKIAPPNSLIFVSDIDGDEPVDFTSMKTIMWNSTCVAVVCLAFMDGQTEVTIGVAKEVEPGWTPAFDDYLETPKQSVIVSTSEREILLECPVQTKRTRIRIWINHEKEPDRVAIGFGED